MLLENLNLTLEDIPRLEDRDFKGLERDYLYYRITGRVLFLLLISGVGASISLFGKMHFGYWLYPVLGILFLVLVLETVGFKYRGYSIRSMDVSFRRGWIVHRMTTVPLNRVQHCEFSQGLLGRLFDLATVRVFTAGGTSSDLDIRGLRKEDAIKVRDYITKLSAEYE
ncbi:PH domain-containing protein [Croceimicrobium hydrocarbonivorans]|uniref:PH domain-containing protein n=1 Tax=Croceimicrobium hydrocarbonivorans TaxID=2761580 RepID=A0A7H0VDG3_9FLAO|nr:PH domain-containing protein [Croceimicrobium hydrocarbonivorans]QNR23761.1 PH domain-containing protein [Croceimicrobium hydrocarbonivorans]